MARLGQKKTRSVAAATLGQASFADRLLEMLRNRSALLRLSICAVAIVLLVIAVRGWRAPFTYRLRDYADHGITAKIDFHRVNQIETNRARADAEAQVSLIFQHNPTPLESLPEQLKADLEAVAAATSATELPADVQSAFGLVDSVSEDSGGASADAEVSFESLRASMMSDDQPVEDRLGVLFSEFTQFLKPIKEKGLTTAAELSEVGVRGDQRIAVVSQGEDETRVIAAPGDVQLASLL